MVQEVAARALGAGLVKLGAAGHIALCFELLQRTKDGASPGPRFGHQRSNRREAGELFVSLVGEEDENQLQDWGA
jgi:hypothetical protein